MKSIITLLLCITNLLYAEGFVTETLVHTQHGIVSIEQLHSGDRVIINSSDQLSYAVTHTTTNIADRYIKITIKDSFLCVAPDQKVYVLNKGWICAEDLIISDKLLCADKKYICCDEIETINEPCKMYAISVESHIFCITEHCIIVHNAEPVGTIAATIFLPICPPLSGVIMVGEIIAFGVAGCATYLIHKKSKYKHQSNENSFVATGSGGCPCGGKPPKHEKDEIEHPHGIYEDAGYHHPNSSGKKSASPKNGQKCLDNSFSVGPGTQRRISIENRKFVILEETCPGKFHGYVIDSWKLLEQRGSASDAIRKAFRQHELVNKSGKIIKDLF